MVKKRSKKVPATSSSPSLPATKVGVSSKHSVAHRSTNRSARIRQRLHPKKSSDSPDADDFDQQTRAFLQDPAGVIDSHGLSFNPHTTLAPSPISTSQVHNVPTRLKPPGHILADVGKDPRLSMFLNKPWHAYLPSAWKRMKNIDCSNDRSLGALSTALMASLGLIGRLTLSGLIDSTAGLAFLGTLFDSAYGKDGITRCRYTLECLLVELYSAVLDGRCTDCSILDINPRSPFIEAALTRFIGFLPPPPPSNSAYTGGSGTSSYRGKGKGKGRYDRQQDAPPLESRPSYISILEARGNRSSQVTSQILRPSSIWVIDHKLPTFGR